MLFSALLNVVWEMFAIAFYDMPSAAPSRPGIATGCLLAALGDVGITLVAYAAASAIAGRRWLFHPSRSARAAYLGLGIAVTIMLEYVNVRVLHRWAYASGMPTVAGIGALPLVQWLVLPLIVLWLARRHLAGVVPGDPSRATS